jgi:carbon storage regulator
MLVLSREPGEKILIGADVTLTVLAIEGGRIRLAISAPPQTTVLREELHLADRAAAAGRQGEPER